MEISGLLLYTISSYRSPFSNFKTKQNIKPTIYDILFSKYKKYREIIYDSFIKTQMTKFLTMSEELAHCTNPQPGEPVDFCSRFSSSSP